MDLAHSDIPRIHKALKDVSHELCAVVVLDGNAYADVVAEAATGEIIAWDGWYGDESASGATPLAEVEWSDWDDMPTKLLIRSTSPWASDHMAYWLLPSFSPAREAATMVWQCEHQQTSDEARRTMRNGRVVAYLPITDRDVYEAVLAVKRSR